MVIPLSFEVVDLPADAIEVGRIVGAWGVKGWFKVLAYSQDSSAILSCKRWYVQSAERGVPVLNGPALLPVVEAKVHSDAIVARAQGIDDRDAAQALHGVRIFVSRADFPVAAVGEYYWVDLVGLDVCNREGIHLGCVKDLLSTGPQTVLVIEYQDAGKNAERMIPFVAVFIDDVSFEHKKITVDWQPDY